jgi:hypothetical protein
LVTSLACDGVKARSGALEHAKAKHVHELGILLCSLKKLAEEA